MFSLIKNEFIKIVKRKSFVFFCLIFLLVPVAFAYVEKTTLEAAYSNSENTDYAIETYKGKADYYKELLETYDKDKNRSEYLGALYQYDYYLIASQIESDWKREKFINDSNFSDYIYSYDEALLDNDTDSYNEYKKKFDDLYNELMNNGFAYFVKKDKEAVIKEKNELEKTIASTTDKDVLFDLNNELTELNRKIEAYSYEENLVGDLSSDEEYLYFYLIQFYTEAVEDADYGPYFNINDCSLEIKYDYYESKATVAEYKYQLDNKYLGDYEGPYGKYNLGHKLGYASGYMRSDLESISLWVIIFLIIFIGKIIGSEFEKGTIKQLLCRPYTRYQILASKIITALIVMLGLVVVHNIIMILEYGCICGFDTFKDQLVYNYSTGVVSQISFWKYMLITNLGLLPEYVFITLMMIMVGVIFKSTLLSSIVPFILIIVPSFFNYYVSGSKYMRNIAIYTPFYTWDWNNLFYNKVINYTYDFGCRPILVCVGWIALTLIVSNVVFKRIEIKNQ